MKTSLLLSIFLVIAGCAYADVYVLTDSTTAVKGLSEQNDMILPKGDAITIINGTIANLPITGDVTLYDFANNTFKLNSVRVQAQQATQAAQIAQQTATQTALCTDYASYMGLATSLGLPAQATTAQIQTALTTLEGDGTNQANVNNATKIGLEFLALMNDIQQNGSNWANIKACN